MPDAAPRRANRYLSALSAILAATLAATLAEAVRNNLLDACKADKNPDLHDDVMLALCTGPCRGEPSSSTDIPRVSTSKARP